MMIGKQGFQQRANDIFGALDLKGDAAGKWNLAEHQVFEAGRDANYSSDEDREAEKRESRLPVNLFYDGTENGDGQQEMPSNAFCRALDAEPEMDANDAVAEGLSYSKKDRLPSRKMEVLDDNVFDKQSRASLERELANSLSSSPRQGSSPKAHVPMDIDIAMPTDSPSIQEDPENPDAATRLRMSVIHDVSTLGRPKTPPPSESISPRRRSNEGRETPRKVRFGEVTEFPDHKPDSAGPMSPRTTEANGVKSSLKSSSDSKTQTSARPSSYVPDHIKHPERYREYALETPIVVGSGNDGSGSRPAQNKDLEGGDDHDRSNNADGAATEDYIAGDIRFNPSRRKDATMKSASTQNEAADRVNQKFLTSLDANSDEEENQAVGVNNHTNTGPPDAAFKTTTKRNRNIRTSNKD